MSLLSNQRFVVIDVETTGWRPSRAAGIIEIGRVILEEDRIVSEWSTLLRSPRPIPIESIRIHGITDEMVKDAPEPAEIAAGLRADCADLPLVFHNAPFDVPFLAALFRRTGEAPLSSPVVDTLGLARGLAEPGGHALASLAERLGLPAEPPHRALGDARTAARCFVALAPRWERERGVHTLLELAAASQDVVRQTRRARDAERRAAAAASDGTTLQTSLFAPSEPAQTIASIETRSNDVPPWRSLMQATAVPEVGQRAPDFTLRGPGGTPVTLEEYRGRNVVLVFYPLAFSPVCSHQLPSIQREIPEFLALDAVVLGISIDSHYANTAFAKQLGVSFPLLSDFDRKASAAYGVLDQARGYSGRAIFVVDAQGRIAYRDVSPKLEDVPSNARVLEALRALR